ncbi:UNVERIFIED_ORG: PLP-dependent aminotransferase family protein (plasmid) [Roseateles sp. XES5]|nr:PLP-dependent aminotransferase family protein [Roseateles sp. XES5]
MTVETAGGRTLEVMAAIRDRIAARALAPGDRLPSIRRFATTMGVSPSTVVEAYDRLAAEGLIRAQRGSGFYVANSAQPPLKLAAETPRAQAVDPFWVSRQSLDADEAALKPGCGWLPADWMPNEALRRAIRGLARSDSTLLAYYGSTRGSPALRRLLLARLAEDGIEAGPEHLMLTNTGTQALDLVCRFLLRPGDCVLIDDPCYFNFQALLKAHQVRLVGVPYTPAGPDIAALESVLATERPRLYITNSAIHNPTGATLSPQVAHRLLNAATGGDMTIVEDDIFADFEPEPSTRLAALDGLSRVIRIGSYSKTLSASARCGYIAARPDWIEGLVDLQIATNFGGPNPISSEIIAHMLSGGSYRKHMEELRRRLVRARRETADRLRRLGIEPWLLPRGGFNLWCRLPEELESGEVAQAAIAEGVVLAPGNVFSVSAGAAGFMRFNVAHMQEPRVYAALTAAMRRAGAAKGRES